MRGALHAAGDVFAGAIESTAPVRTGELKDDIIVAVHVSGDLRENYVIVGPGYDRGKLLVRGTKIGRRGETEAIVNTSDSPGVYALFVERGHAAPGHGKAQQRKGKSAHEIEYGGRSTPAHPFMRPAWEVSKDAGLEAFVAYVRAGLAGVAAAARSL
jgi:HK97 gp10 family phage protein